MCNLAISYTILTAKTSLTKRVWVAQDGTLAKHAAANPIHGTFAHIEHVGNPDDILDAYSNVLRGQVGQDLRLDREPTFLVVAPPHAAAVVATRHATVAIRTNRGMHPTTSLIVRDVNTPG